MEFIDCLFGRQMLDTSDDLFTVICFNKIRITSKANRFEQQQNGFLSPTVSQLANILPPETCIN